jgi:hypothetical protein
VCVLGDVIALVDDDRGKTITNDAEGVVEDLRRGGYDLARARVIYRDTMGRWDELVVQSGRFAGFRSLGVAGELADAIEQVRSSEVTS